jgi:hypothetical protein
VGLPDDAGHGAHQSDILRQPNPWAVPLSPERAAIEDAANRRCMLPYCPPIPKDRG